MQIDFLGHASILVHGREGCVLFDPLLLGVHHEGLYDIYPPRTLHTDRLPRFDAVVLTHSHSDHFDVPTLACLPKDTPTLVPPDPLMLDVLERLGFTSVRTIRDFDKIEIGSLTLCPTPSAQDAIENGYVINDGSAVVWNMVDTIPTCHAIAEVKKRFSKIDLAIVPWQALQDTEFMSGHGVEFPHDMYATILGNILQISSRHVVPGACGFRAIGAPSWTNSLIFPVTRERFIADIVAANPEWSDATHVADAGDAINLDGEVHVERRKLEYCRSAVYEWEERAFQPHVMGFPVTENQEKYSRGNCLKDVDSFFHTTVSAFVADYPTYFHPHYLWHVRHQFQVAFSDHVEAWYLDFSKSSLRISRGRSPLAATHTAITSSAMIGLLEGTLSWDFSLMSGSYRHYDFTYKVDSTGLRVPPKGAIVDPLLMIVAGRQQSIARTLRWQVDELRRTSERRVEIDGLRQSS